MEQDKYGKRDEGIQDSRATDEGGTIAGQDDSVICNTDNA